MKRSYKILAIGGCMELFVLLSILSYHVFLSHAPYNPLLEILGNVVHPVMFGGVVALLTGAIIFLVDRKAIQKM